MNIKFKKGSRDLIFKGEQMTSKINENEIEVKEPKPFEILLQIIRNAIFYIRSLLKGPYEVCYPSPDEVLDGYTYSEKYASKDCENYAREIINEIRKYLTIYVYDDGTIRATYETPQGKIIDIFKGKLNKQEIEDFKFTLKVIKRFKEDRTRYGFTYYEFNVPKIELDN